MPRMSFDKALPRLSESYALGRLVPFLGAGMSVPACPDWRTMIEKLAAVTEGYESQPDGKANADQLMREASQIATKLRRQGLGVFSERLRRVIYAPKESPTAQTTALVKMDWPLILTTNYDDLLYRSYNRRLKREAEEWARKSSVKGPVKPEEAQVLGRSVGDCQRVISSLDAPASPLIWALQGFLQQDKSTPLEAEIVLGHEEYRRVTHMQQHFRRTFAEVYRRRSLLFLGSSVGEPYFLDLFGEVIEVFGSNPMPHYAFTNDDLDDEFLRSRFNIIVIRYDEHHEIPAMLQALRDAVVSRSSRPTVWSYRLRSEAKGEAAASADLTIEDSPLPKPDPSSHECVALSAGLTEDNSLYLTPPFPRYADEVDAGFRSHASGERLPDGPMFFSLAGAADAKPCPLVAIAAWTTWDRRRLTFVRPGVRRALDWAAANGFAVMRLPLIGAGRTRHFHPRFSLMEIVRAFSEWRRDRANAGSPVRMVIHVVDQAAIRDLTSGTLNVLELLDSADLRFWLEIVDGDRLERELLIRDESDTVSELAADYSVNSEAWEVEVEPRIAVDQAAIPVREAPPTLRAIGVLPGSTLRFRRRVDGSGGSSALAF